MLVLELCSTTLKQERFKGKICALSSFKKGKEGNEKFKVPKCTETKKIQSAAFESKGMDERHANSTFSQVHWGRAFSFIKNPLFPSTKNREGTGRTRQKRQAAVNPRDKE